MWRQLVDGKRRLGLHDHHDHVEHRLDREHRHGLGVGRWSAHDVHAGRDPHLLFGARNDPGRRNVRFRHGDVQAHR
jgi:hypothetical protein